MGDRTTVTLTVLTLQAEAAKALFSHEPKEDIQDGPITSYIFNEINYGNLQFLSKIRDAGIPYDSSWGDGNNYKSGSEHGRFTSEGEFISKEFYDADINPDLNELLKLIDKPDKLRQAILDHKEKVTVSNLADEPEQNGKLYRALKLIGVTKQN